VAVPAPRRDPLRNRLRSLGCARFPSTAPVVERGHAPPGASAVSRHFPRHSADQDWDWPGCRDACNLVVAFIGLPEWRRGPKSRGVGQEAYRDDADWVPTITTGGGV